MKVALKNQKRTELLNMIANYIGDHVENDYGQVTSGSINFPFVIEGEEGWAEVCVKITNYDDEEGYGLREDYEVKCKEREEKKKKAEELKKKKIKKSQEEREFKRKEREKRKLENEQ